MAYSTNLHDMPVVQKSGEPYFGYGYDTGVPNKVFAVGPTQKRATALNHLTNAIAYYERAAKLVFKGTNATAHQWLIVPIHLGLAWTLDQAGRKQDATEAYREALKLAWRREVDPNLPFKDRMRWSWDQLRAGNNPLTKPPSRGHLGPGVCYSDEVIGYLLALLDPKKDGKEIAQLQADRKTLRSMGRAITSILVPLKDALSFEDLIDLRARVAFDLDGSGELRRWRWLTTNAAWLVFDRNGERRVTSGLQMFGNVTFWIFWRDGYDALASLDDNDDGQLSGTELNGLALWCDRNGNGVSEPGEVKPVQEFGITTISCRSAIHSSGIPFNPRGITFAGGRQRATYDWIVPSTDNGEAVASR